MDRMRSGLILAIVGVLVFIISLYVILNFVEFYLLSLLSMFLGVVLIGLGSALAKGFDRSLDVETDLCYYCEGTGKIKGIEGPETCPRCGGTGLARPDDQS
jgi:hypothetical protein